MVFGILDLELQLDIFSSRKMTLKIINADMSITFRVPDSQGEPQNILGRFVWHQLESVKTDCFS